MPFVKKGFVQCRMNADLLLDSVVVGLHARSQSDVHPEDALLPHCGSPGEELEVNRRIISLISLMYSARALKLVES